MKLVEVVLFSLLMTLVAIEGGEAKKLEKTRHNDNSGDGESAESFEDQAEDELTDLRKKVLNGKAGTTGWDADLIKLGKLALERKQQKQNDVRVPTDSDEVDALEEDKGKAEANIEQQLETFPKDAQGKDSSVALRAKNALKRVSSTWKNMDATKRNSYVLTLNTVAGNIQNFANAGEDPILAIQGGINIVGALASFAGPVGQIVSVVASFVSAFLGLFNKGSKQAPDVTSIVREEIRSALDDMRAEDMKNKAVGNLLGIQNDLDYLDGFEKDLQEPISTKDVNKLLNAIEVKDSIVFMGTFSSFLNTWADVKDAKRAAKVMKLINSFASLCNLKDLTIQRMINLIPLDVHPDERNNINGIAQRREGLFESQKPLYQKFYSLDTTSKVVPLYDPQAHANFDAYAKALGITTYPDLYPGLRCIKNKNNKYVEWSSVPTSKLPYPYLKHTDATPKCTWRIVNHGNNLVSVFSKEGSFKDHGLTYCIDREGFFLRKDMPYLALHPNDARLWKMEDYNGGKILRLQSRCDKGWECNRVQADGYILDGEQFKGVSDISYYFLAMNRKYSEFDPWRFVKA